MFSTTLVHYHLSLPHFQAWILWKEEKWNEVTDPCLDTSHQNMEVRRLINIALMCVQDNAVDLSSYEREHKLARAKTASLLQYKDSEQRRMCD
jgi:hypothetical protein